MHQSIAIKFQLLRNFESWGELSPGGTTTKLVLHTLENWVKPKPKQVHKCRRFYTPKRYIRTQDGRPFSQKIAIYIYIYINRINF